jgi:hypothetical protein
LEAIYFKNRFKAIIDQSIAMARHTRSSLDYFPVDTSWNLKKRLVLAKFGLEGIGALIQLEQMIFREGYACAWNEETENLFVIENSTTKECVDKILEYCLAHEIFDREILEHYGCLTSKVIQIQWIKVCDACHRKNCTITPELSLVDDENLNNDDEPDEEVGNLPSKSEKVGFPPIKSEEIGGFADFLRQQEGRKERNKKKEDLRNLQKPAQSEKGFYRAGESSLMQQILRSLETKKEKGPD